jgi:hypothetical protein
MSREELQRVYEEAWALYYTPRHIETLLRRAAVTNVPMMSIAKVLVQFSTMMQLEKVHPLQSGLLRMRHPDELRPGLPRESALLFYPRLIRDLIVRNAKFVRTAWWIMQLKRRIERDPNRNVYMDQALTPVQDDEMEETFDYLTKTDGAKAAIDHLKKVAELTHGTHVPLGASRPAVEVRAD